MFASTKTIFNLSKLPSEILQVVHPHLLIYYFI